MADLNRKVAILETLRALIIKEIEEYRAICESASVAVQKADGRMQSRYDTQRYDYALEVHTAKQLMDELLSELRHINLIYERSTSPSAEKSPIVIVGSLVEANDGRALRRYLLLPSHGGRVVHEFELVLISKESPIGKVLLGKRVGCVVALSSGNQTIEDVV